MLQLNMWKLTDQKSIKGSKLDNMDYNQPPALVQHYGLLNQGATCYLNSVLQVLFMTKEFREAVERHTCENPGTEYIDLQLKNLFVDLQQHTTNTYAVTEKLGINNVYEQRDAAEYFEKILSLTSPDASQIFHGECTNRTTCFKCGKYEDADGYFWHLPLGLNWNSKDYSVVAGVEQYFQTSYLNEEDQMYCDQCDSKCDATIKSVMKHHPEVLMLLLKRFDFDCSYMTYVKNNSAVDIPFTLQIPENQTYELYAFVDHFGDLRGGHYTTKIKYQDDERWYEFNDASVTLINRPLFQGNNCEKSSGVYLLFYKKTKKTNPTRDENVQDAEEVMEQEQGEKRTDMGNDDSAEDIFMDIDETKQMMKNQSSHLCDYGLDEKPQQNDRNILKDEEEERGQKEVAEQSEQSRLLLTEDQSKERVEDENNGDRQMMQNLDPGWNGKSSHLGNYYPAAQSEKPKQETRDVVKDDQEGHQTEADEQVEKGELVLTNSHLKEDQENYIVRWRIDIHHEFKPETSDRHARQDHLDKEDKMSEEREEGQDHESRSHMWVSNHEFKAKSSDSYAMDDHLNKKEEMREERVEFQDSVRQVMQNTYQGSNDESYEQRDDVKLETSYKLAGHEHVCHEHEISELLRGVVNIKKVRVESSQGDEKEMKETCSLENPPGDTECKSTEGLDSVGKKNTNQANEQEVGQNHKPQLVSADKKEEMREIEYISDRDRQTGAHQPGDKQTLRSRGLLTKYDLYLESCQDSARVDDS